MSPRKITVPIVVLSVAALSLGGCGRNAGLATSTTGPDLRGDLAALGSSLVVVPFDPTGFVASVDNPYLPLTPGTIHSFTETTDEGVETNDVEVTHDTKTILGVATTVVHDRVYLNGSLKEDTFDWYAQDRGGNVWYFGEDTKELENGQVVSTAGSWEAGQNGAKAGVIMLAHPKIGDAYQQEDSPGIVADHARVLSLKETATVPYGTFSHCLKTMEWTPLEPGVREFKYYAVGIGPVLELSPKGGRHRVELIAVTP
jgi:hypothetical protein